MKNKKKVLPFLDESELNQMKMYCNEANKSPFDIVEDKERECYKLISNDNEPHDGDGAKRWIADIFDAQDALFFTTARNSIPRMIEEIESYRKVIAEILSYTKKK